MIKTPLIQTSVQRTGWRWSVVCKQQRPAGTKNTYCAAKSCGFAKKESAKSETSRF
jgi:hypothetical protein